MMSVTSQLGLDSPFYILSFDQRRSPLGVSVPEEMLTPEQMGAIESAKSQIALAKYIIYDGFRAALAAGVPQSKAGVLVDEQFGADILRDAVARGYHTAYPIEKVRHDEFDFEYGEEFTKHIEDFQPTFCHAQVRYRPEGNQDRRQSDRLKILSDYLHGTGRQRTLFMLELLVPAEKVQLGRINESKSTDESEIHSRLVVQAVHELQDAGVEPDVWTIAGMNCRDDYEKVVVAARCNGRDKIGCIIVDEGQNAKSVRESLMTGASVPGIMGFAVGPSIFAEPLTHWGARRTVHKAAATEIAQRYKDLVTIFENRRLKDAA
jgi:myo-inositol catabolism protein IolC